MENNILLSNFNEHVRQSISISKELEMEIDISGEEVIDCGGLFSCKENSELESKQGNVSSPDADADADANVNVNATAKTELDLNHKSKDASPSKIKKKPKLFLPSSGKDDADAGLRGLNGLESVVASLERRFAAGDDSLFYSESSESDNDIVTKGGCDSDNGNGNAPTKKRKRKKKKATKEEREWLDEGRGFLDDEFAEEVDRKASDKGSKLLFDGFYVFRGPLSKQTVEDTDQKGDSPAKKGSKNHKKTANGKSSSEESEASGSDIDESDFVSSLPSNSTSSIKRVRDLLDSLDNATETLSEQFPPALDLALTNLEKVVKKSVPKYTKNEGYRAMLLDLMPIDPEIVVLNMRRIRLLSNVRFHKSSYIKSVGTLRKWTKERIASLQNKLWNAIDPDVWMLTFNSLIRSDGKLKSPEVVHAKLEKLYKIGFLGTPAGTSEATWSQVKKKASKVEDLVFEIDKGDDYAEEAKEICRMCTGLIARMEKKKIKFLWNKEGRKLVKDVGICHRKWSYSAAKVRHVETQLYSEPKTEGKTRRSMIKQVCIIWPERSMHFEEIVAMTADSIAQLPKEFKLTAKDKSPKKSSKKPGKEDILKKEKEIKNGKTKSPTKEKKKASVKTEKVSSPKKKKTPEKKKNSTGKLKKKSEKLKEKKGETPEKKKSQKRKDSENKRKGKKSKFFDKEEEIKPKKKQKKSTDDGTDMNIGNKTKLFRSVTFEAPPKYKKSDFPYPKLPKKKK